MLNASLGSLNKVYRCESAIYILKLFMKWRFSNKSHHIYHCIKLNVPLLLRRRLLTLAGRHDLVIVGP